MAGRISKTGTDAAPAVGRAAAILNFLARHPKQAFSLAEIVRSLKLSRTTCHSLLGALVEVGYLYRTNDREYVLGPTLAAVGKIAYDNASPLQVAQPEMRVLADRFDAICSAVFLEDNKLVVRASAVAASHLQWPNPLSNVMPWQAPTGSVFLAWAEPSEIDAWFARAPNPSSATDHQALAGALAFTRKNGFSFGIRRHALSDARRSRDMFGSFEDTELLNSRLDPACDYELAAVNGMVFDFRGDVAFSIVLGGFVGTRTGEELTEIGTALRDACDRISAFGSGRVPYA